MRLSPSTLTITIALLASLTSARADDISAMRQRLTDLYAGVAGAAPGAYHDAALADCQTRAAALLQDPKAWPDLSAAKPANLGGLLARHFADLRQLAQAFTAPGTPLAGSDQLKPRIEAALRTGLKYIAPGTPRPGNWYQWLIEIPGNLGPALLILDGKIDPALVHDGIKAMAGLMGEPSLSGANAVWEGRNQLYLGLLQHDPKRIALAAEFVSREISVGPGATGILEDYSFQFHGRILETKSYGGGYARSAAEVMYLCNNSPWAIEPARQTLFANYLLEHARWTIIHKEYDLSVRGRAVLKGDRGLPHVEAMILLAALKGPESSALSSAAAQALAAADNHPSLVEASLLDSEKPAKIPPLTGFRQFYASDFAVFRRPDFYTSVRMYSDRLLDYEGNWGKDLTGWFLCYGLTYFSRTGEELWANHALASADYDWDRLPGTTTRIGVHPPASYNNGTSLFAGGAGGGTPDSGGLCGFILVPAAGDFTAHKSYFFFDQDGGGFVALGTAIDSTAKHPEHVNTTITQWAAPTADLPLVLSGQRTQGPFDGDKSWDNVAWAWHDGVGYIFFKPVTLCGHRRGTLTTLWLDHGPAPTDASYAYIVLPNATQQQTEKLAANPPVRILQQDATAHIVEETSGRSAGYLFWKAGSAAGITVDAPTMLYREQRNAGQVFSVQNPLHTAATLHLRLAGPLPPESDKAPEFSFKQADDACALALQTWNGRIYRIAFGAGKIAQQPRADFAPAADFHVEAATTGNATTITAHIPPALMKAGYQLLIRDPTGHLLAALTDADIIDRPAPDVVRYRWTRKPALIQSGEQNFSADLFSALWQVRSPFKIPLAGASTK